MNRQALIGLAHYQNKNGTLAVNAATTQKANEVVSEILQKYSDSKTALFLSGGSTPKKLYEDLAAKKTLKAGAVLQIDERFGEKMHKNSNELMIKNSGLLGYIESQNIRFYSILEGKEIGESARNYDEALRFVFEFFPKSVGILGIGQDGHSAGIPTDSTSVRKMIEDQSSLVSHYALEGYGERITLNFNALSMLDLIILLVLGQEKREILSSLFKNSEAKQEDVEKFPSKFYLKPEIAEKTILVTDQIF